LRWLAFVACKALRVLHAPFLQLTTIEAISLSRERPFTENEMLALLQLPRLFVVSTSARFVPTGADDGNGAAGCAASAILAYPSPRYVHDAAPRTIHSIQMPPRCVSIPPQRVLDAYNKRNVKWQPLRT
jgi:hypothetical protein